MWLTVVCVWGATLYATARTQSLVRQQGAALAVRATPDYTGVLTRTENLEELPVERMQGQLRHLGNRVRLEWKVGPRMAVLEWQATSPTTGFIPDSEPVIVRAFQANTPPQTGMRIEIVRMTYPLGYYCVIRDSGGNVVNVWELLWNT